MKFIHEKTQIRTRINTKVISRNFAFCFALFSVIIMAFFTGFSIVEGATLYILPQSQNVWQGDTFIAEVWLDTEGETINTVEGYLTFPQDKLRAIDISEGGSILSLWLQPPSFSNPSTGRSDSDESSDSKSSGQVSFVGGVPNGFSGQGRLFSVTFRGEGDGVELSFSEDSRVLLHDGKGSLASLNFGEGEYRFILKPENLPQITSSSHPDENKWEQKNDLYLRWQLTEGAQYSYLLSRDPSNIPDEIKDVPEGELIWQGDIVYNGLGDGIYYFHLRQNTAGIWSPKITYRAMIDTAPPEPFQPEITEIEDKNYLVFNTLDNTSGIDFYEAQEGEGLAPSGVNWQKAQSPYLLEDQTLGGKISVRAVDKAGNEALAEITPFVSLPKKIGGKNLLIIFSFLAFLTVFLLTFFLKKRSRRTVLR